MASGSLPVVKRGRGVTLTPHPLLVRWSRKSRAIPLLPHPYSLYRASVPVQYSYTSTPPMDRTACTEPQCLYSTAIPLLPLWAVQPVQSLSACTRVGFTFFSPVENYPHLTSIFLSTRRKKMEQTDCSETSGYKIRTPGNHPKERIPHSQHDESLKSVIIYLVFLL